MDTLEEGKVPIKMNNKLIARGDGPYKILQKVGDNAYKIELQGKMNILATFNVGDLTPYIEDEDEGYKYLRENPLQGREVDAGQVTQGNLLNHIKVIVWIAPMVLITLGLQGLGFPKCVLTWALKKANSKFRNDGKAISSLK